MLNMAEKLKTALENAVKSIAEDRGYSVPDGFIVRLERPRQSGHGDWATNIAMQLAKPFGVNPRELAVSIIDSMPKENLIENAEVAGPGFMNFTLASSWITEAVKSAIEKKENYGRVNVGKGHRVQIEFVSANPTGPLHMGHGRGAAVGDITASKLPVRTV